MDPEENFTINKPSRRDILRIAALGTVKSVLGGFGHNEVQHSLDKTFVEHPELISFEEFQELSWEEIELPLLEIQD